MAAGVASILDRLWSEYARFNPEAQRIHQLLADHGDPVVHDHVALRTLRHPKLGIDATARLFERHGYHARGEYEFPERKLYARHYEADEPGLPKILISELKLEECSRGLRDIIGSLTRQIDPAQLSEEDLVFGGCPWYPILRDTYARLRQESEYAAWLAAFGFRAHHFAVLVNELDAFDSLAELNHLLKENGFVLESLAGEIDGSPDLRLERSATLPVLCPVRLADGQEQVPGSRYEFMLRYPLPSGELFPGFVTDSAESPAAPRPPDDPTGSLCPEGAC